MKFVYNDGGRKDTGYKGEAGDCVTRAIAIATDLPYQQVYDDLNALSGRERRGSRKRGVSSARVGVYKQTQRRYLGSLGWVWTPTMHIGQGCRVHLLSGELPMGRLIVQVSKHVVAVIDGVIHDTHDCSRDGTRCVYGYWSYPPGCSGPPEPGPEPPCVLCGLYDNACACPECDDCGEYGCIKHLSNVLNLEITRREMIPDTCFHCGCEMKRNLRIEEPPFCGQCDPPSDDDYPYDLEK